MTCICRRPRGRSPAGNTPQEFRKRIDGEVDRWAPIIKAAGVKIN